MAQSASLSWGVGPSLLAFTLLLFAVGFVLPGFPMGHCAQDFAAILDGAYRLLQGQIPHVDFSLPIGSLPLVQGVLALKLASLMPEFYTFQLTIWLLLAPVVWRLALRQPGFWLKVLVAGVVGVLSLVPYIIVYEPIPEFNYNALYNRAAAAVLFLGFVWAVSPKRRGMEDVLLVCWLILLALAWKVSHAIVLIGTLAVVAGASPVARRTLLIALVASAAILLALDVASAGIVRGYFSDIKGMIAINRGGVVGQMMFLAIRCLMVLPPLLLLIFLLRPSGRISARLLRRPEVWLRIWRPAVLVLLFFLALLASESQGTGNVALFGLLVLPLLVARLRWRQRALTAGVAVVVALLGAYPMVEGMLRRGTTLVLRQASSYHPEPALAPVLGRVLVSARNDETARSFAVLWQEPGVLLGAYRRFERDFSGGMNPMEAGQGLSWARGVVEMARIAQGTGLVTQETRVTSVGFTEPFARALGVKSALGTKLWLDPGRTIGTLGVPQVQGYLVGADVVFVQLCPARESLADLNTRPFGLILQAEFARVAQTACYEMWSRRQR